MAEEKIQKLKEYQKNYREANKSKKTKFTKKTDDHNKLFADLFSYLSMHCLNSIIYPQRCFDSL